MYHPMLESDGCDTFLEHRSLKCIAKRSCATFLIHFGVKCIQEMYLTYISLTLRHLAGP